jgi:hypothetical protein
VLRTRASALAPITDRNDLATKREHNRQTLGLCLNAAAYAAEGMAWF